MRGKEIACNNTHLQDTTSTLKKKKKKRKKGKNEAYRVLPLLSFSKLVNFSASHFIGNENAVERS